MNAEEQNASHNPSLRKKARGPRKIVRVACARCIRNKTRCDNTRPACGSCQRANVVCAYDTRDPEESRLQAIRRQNEDLQSIQAAARDSIYWLCGRPPAVALSLLERLSIADDPMRDLCSMVAEQRSQLILPSPPGLGLVATSSSPIQNSSTAQLASRYPATFPRLSDSRLLHQRDDTRQQEAPYYQLPSRSVLTTQGQRRTLEPNISESREKRLSSLAIGFWTTVPISNETAAKLISLYLHVEHPIYGFFDAELFLQDLLAQRVQYCSSLLVNAILFWTSCSFGSWCPEVFGLADAFLESAQRLLEGERHNTVALNVASYMVLTISTICFGKDKLADQFMTAGIKMAETLSLIGEGRWEAARFAATSRSDLSMLSHVGWGAFNLSTVLLLHFHDPSSGTYTKYPPLLPRPTATTPNSEISVSSFPFFCDFWCIAHQIASTLYSCPALPHQDVPLAFVESKLHQLLEWAESLPDALRRCDTMPHNVAEMHICYHATIMDLFRPFIAHRQYLSTIISDPDRPKAIFMLSFEQLQDLTRFYHTSFASRPESRTISWIHGPLYVAPAILHYTRHEGWEQDFAACIASCSGLFQSHQVVEGFLRALLGMAVVAGACSLDRAVDCLDGMRAMREAGGTSGIPQAAFVVDQDLAMDDPKAAVGNVLAQKFDEMLFAEDPFGQV